MSLACLGVVINFRLIFPDPTFNTCRNIRYGRMMSDIMQTRKTDKPVPVNWQHRLLALDRVLLFHVQACGYSLHPLAWLR